MKNSPTFISLFSGCGGFDIGFKHAGYGCLGAFDIDKLALDNLTRYTKSPIFQTDLSASTLSRTGYSGQSPDVVLSGSPCQGFSTIGKRNFEDPRNALLVSGAEIAVELQPKVFIAENVPGVISGRHREYWDRIHGILKSAGYNTRDLLLDANDFGTPQHRKRVFLFAYRGQECQFSIPRVAGGVLADALKDITTKINHSEEYLEKGSDEYIIATKIQQGQKLSNVRGGARSVHTWDIPEVFGSVTKKERRLLEELLYLRRRLRVRNFGDADPVPRKILRSKYGESTIKSLTSKNYLRAMGDNIDLVGAFNGKYRRLWVEKPSCTVDTRFGHAKSFLHPTLHRPFTVREAARIQGFPDSYHFSGSPCEQFRMIGNAVPPPLGYAIGLFCKAQLI